MYIIIIMYTLGQQLSDLLSLVMQIAVILNVPLNRSIFARIRVKVVQGIVRELATFPVCGSLQWTLAILLISDHLRYIIYNSFLTFIVIYNGFLHTHSPASPHPSLFLCLLRSRSFSLTICLPTYRSPSLSTDMSSILPADRPTDRSSN